MLLLSEKLMNCCAESTNGYLDLRRRATALDGRVSAELSRCPGSMARRPRDSVFTLRRSSAGWIPARIGTLSAGIGCRHPVTICKASLMVGSMRWVWVLRHQTAAQYSAVNGPGIGWPFAILLLQRPNRSQQAASGVRRVMLAPCEVTESVGGTWATCPTLLRHISAWSRKAGFRCWGWLSAHA